MTCLPNKQTKKEKVKQSSNFAYRWGKKNTYFGYLKMEIWDVAFEPKLPQKEEQVWIVESNIYRNSHGLLLVLAWLALKVEESMPFHKTLMLCLSSFNPFLFY